MSTVTINESSDQRSVVVEKSDTIVVSLPENPSTGFRWGLDSPVSSVLQLEGDEYQGSATPGAGTLRVMRFKPLKAGAINLNLKLWREWEGENSTTKRLAVNLQVK